MPVLRTRNGVNPTPEMLFSRGGEAMGQNIRSLSVLVLFLLLSLSLAGCLDNDDDDGEDTVPKKIEKPQWQIGQNWVYSFNTPEFPELSSRLIVATNDSANFQVGVSTLVDARRHAVLNFNPILGRVNMTNMGIYENGESQPFLSFPLEKGKSWEFTLLGVDDWQAQVTDIRIASIPGLGETVLAEISAQDDSGNSLVYTYSQEASWLQSFLFTTPGGEKVLEMSLVSYETGFSGAVFFVRGRDLYDQEYYSTSGGPVVDVVDTFVDSGHPKYGDFDELIYYLEVDVGGNGGGELYLKDHTGESPVIKSYGPNSGEESLGFIPSRNGNWTLEIAMEGTMYLRMRIAGGITYTWDI